MALIARVTITTPDIKKENEFRRDLVQLCRHYAKEESDWCIKLMTINDDAEIVIRGDGSGDATH